MIQIGSATLFPAHFLSQNKLKYQSQSDCNICDKTLAYLQQLTIPIANL